MLENLSDCLLCAPETPERDSNLWPLWTVRPLGSREQVNLLGLCVPMQGMMSEEMFVNFSNISFIQSNWQLMVIEVSGCDKSRNPTWRPNIRWVAMPTLVTSIAKSNKTVKDKIKFKSKLSSWIFYFICKIFLYSWYFSIRSLGSCDHPPNTPFEILYFLKFSYGYVSAPFYCALPLNFILRLI